MNKPESIPVAVYCPSCGQRCEGGATFEKVSRDIDHNWLIVDLSPTHIQHTCQPVPVDF